MQGDIGSFNDTMYSTFGLALDIKSQVRVTDALQAKRDLVVFNPSKLFNDFTMLPIVQQLLMGWKSNRLVSLDLNDFFKMPLCSVN